MTQQTPALVVHGGAWDIPDAAVSDCLEGCRRALRAGWSVLQRGASATDAVEETIAILEDDPVFDAGVGSHLNFSGYPELDAIMMDGSTLKAGAVAAVRHVRNPVRLARRILDKSVHMMFVASGAEEFARENDMPLCDPDELITTVERDAWLLCRKDGHDPERHVSPQGTVGSIAIDASGNLVAGTSTGGICCKRPGRVGDSPIIGCGCYADREAGAAASTGSGEAIMKIVMAKTAVDLLRSKGGDWSAREVAQECIRILETRTGGTGGIVTMTRNGDIGIAFNTRRMAYGFVDADGSPVVSVSQPTQSASFSTKK